MTFQRVLTEARLTKIELAELYGVSRQTIHAWAKGGHPGDGSYVARMAEVITAGLESAIDRRLLPLPPMDREARRARVARMARTLQNLKPAPAR